MHDDLDVLLATTAAIAAHTEVQAVLDEIARQMTLALDGTSAYVMLWQPRQNELIVSADYYARAANDRERRSDIGQAYRMPESRKPAVMAQEVEQYHLGDGKVSPSVEAELHAYGGQSVIYFPMIARGVWLGELEVWDSRGTRIFTAREIRIGSAIAAQAALALDNSKLYEDAVNNAERFAVLHQATQEVIVADLDIEKLYHTIHRAVAKLMPSEAFAISLVDEEAQEIEGVYLIDKGGRAPKVRISMDRGLSGFVVRTGESIIFDDYREVNNPIDPEHFGHEDVVRSVLAVPMRLGTRIIGMLSTQSYRPHAFTNMDMEILESLAAYAAIAIDNTQLLAEIQGMAVTDPLTGIANRRALDQFLESEIVRARRYQSPLSLIFLDIDNFKVYNDLHGHLAGDERLKALAGMLDFETRRPDFVGRFGGEEFVIVLPHTSLDGAVKLAERLRAKAAKAAPVPVEDGEPLPGYTFSAGVAAFPEHGDTMAALLDSADRAMLAAKAAGKNRVLKGGAEE